MPDLIQRNARLTVSMVIAMLVVGCARTSTVSTLYQANEAPVARVLVTARLPDQAQRRQWEQACVPSLASSTRQLVAAHQPLPDWYAGDNMVLLNTAQALGLDAVLVVELSTLLLSPMQLPPRNDVSEERFSGPAGSQPERWQIQLDGERPTPPPDTLAFQARLMATTGTTLWEGLVYTHEANDVTAIARSQCRALDKALGEAGLLP